VGYGENYNQMFIWEVGKSEPIVVDSGFFSKEGSWEWLLQDKYILIDSGKNDIIEKKILGINSMEIVSIFETNSDNIYLIPDTASVIIQTGRTDSLAPVYEIYNFITGEEKRLNFEFQDKDLMFSVDSLNNTINFTGEYIDGNEMIYSVKAVMGIDKLKEKYSIKTLQESIEESIEKDVLETNGEEPDLN
jgi:hypothetical protein